MTLSDGTSIAVAVIYPKHFNPQNRYNPKTGKGGYPTIFEMAGYDNGSTGPDGRTLIGQIDDDYHEQSGNRIPGLTLTDGSHKGTSAFRYDNEYVSVHAQVRGTGCSSGEFDVFSWQAALDGYEIIENWVVKQPWSNQKVGILGHSYSGNTGFMIAAAEGLAKRSGKPSHLVSITVSGMIDDLYRGIVYPGGVANFLFPPVWTLGIRPAYDVLGGTGQGIARNYNHPEIAAQCAQNTARHTRNLPQDPLLNGVSDTDSSWWRAHSMVTWAPLITVPTHITGAFQDEQTGPRFEHLWEVLPAGLPKRLIMTNGHHGTQVETDEIWKDRKAWMDYWMRGVPNRFVDPSKKPVSVRTLLEVHKGKHGPISNGVKDSTSFPLEDTRWVPFFLGSGERLGAKPPAPGSEVYFSGTKRQSWLYQAGPNAGPPLTTARAPDELDFTSKPFRRTTLMDGPITANLFVAATSNDTELFVQVADRDRQGNVTILQRGMLRAAHRSIDGTLSDWDTRTPDPMHPSRPYLYRPWRPHTNPVDIVPLQTYEYLVEVFPVAHVFRPGHSLQVKVMAPPALDSEYAYPPRRAGLNVLFYGPKTPSRITLPFVSLAGVKLGKPIPCGQLLDVRCVRD